MARDHVEAVRAQIIAGNGRTTIGALFRDGLAATTTTRARWSADDVERVRAACVAWHELRPEDEAPDEDAARTVAALVARATPQPEARRQAVGAALWMDERHHEHGPDLRAARWRLALVWLDADTRAVSARDHRRRT